MDQGKLLKLSQEAWDYFKDLVTEDVIEVNQTINQLRFELTIPMQYRNSGLDDKTIQANILNLKDASNKLTEYQNLFLEPGEEPLKEFKP